MLALTTFPKKNPGCAVTRSTGAGAVGNGSHIEFIDKPQA